MNEAELIQDILKGNRNKFRIFVEKYQAMVFSTYMGFLHNKNDADDLTREIFIQVYRSRYCQQKSHL
jgi:RNA polymerase sigma-70 factor (ECF subfamily)